MRLFPSTSNREQRRKAEKLVRKESIRFDPEFVPVDVPELMRPQGLQRAWRNRKFLVQKFAPAVGTEDMVVCRLSVNTIAFDGVHGLDSISWDELQAIKNTLGFGIYEAVEVYPRHRDEVNLASSRHLWVLTGLLPFTWRCGV